MVALVVLARVGDRGVGSAGGQLVVAHQVVIEDLVRQRRHRQAMEGDVVLPQVQVRQPRFQHHFIIREAAVRAQEAELEDIAIEVAQGAVFAHQFDGHHFAHHFVEDDGGVVGQHFHHIGKVARHAFAGGQAVGEELDAGGAIAMRKAQA
ncbi:hypothetical protein D3C72_1692100 [compost metagenome]